MVRSIRRRLAMSKNHTAYQIDDGLSLSVELREIDSGLVEAFETAAAVSLRAGLSSSIMQAAHVSDPLATYASSPEADALTVASQSAGIERGRCHHP